MKQCLQESLALARYYRQIDLFITVTCNPNWSEITCERDSHLSHQGRYSKTVSINFVVYFSALGISLIISQNISD